MHAVTDAGDPIDLKAQVAKLEENVTKLSNQITALEKQFPFSFREKLADEEWIDSEQAVLDKEIAELELEKEKYAEYLILLEEWKPTVISG